MDCLLFFLKVDELRTEMGTVREKIANKDNETVDSIRESFQSLQQKSLKLFELAYKKVRHGMTNILFLTHLWRNFITTIFDYQFVTTVMQTRCGVRYYRVKGIGLNFICGSTVGRCMFLQCALTVPTTEKRNPNVNVTR